jgi:capsular polysaccharide biosynthesis protein
LWSILSAALLAGLLLALIAVAFFAAFDDSLRGEKELAEAIGAPSLGRMPRGEV